jgi:hypothetical protein
MQRDIRVNGDKMKSHAVITEQSKLIVIGLKVNKIGLRISSVVPKDWAVVLSSTRQMYVKRPVTSSQQTGSFTDMNCCRKLGLLL